MAEIELVNPLDYLILEQLPDVGSMHLGAYPNGATAGAVKGSVAEGKLAINVIATRLRVLRIAGHAVVVKGVGGNVWQRTPEGVRVLAEWRKNGSR